MKIKLKTISASPMGTYFIGAVVDFPDSEAIELIKGGYAIAIDPLIIETAVLRPIETAVKVIIKPKKRVKK